MKNLILLGLINFGLMLVCLGAIFVLPWACLVLVILVTSIPLPVLLTVLAVASAVMASCGKKIL